MSRICVCNFRIKHSVVGISKVVFHLTVAMIIGYYVIHSLTYDSNATVYHQTRQMEAYQIANRHPANLPHYEKHEEQYSNLDPLHKDEFPNSECQRKNDIVYIKTHKTGSCTVVNMLYRVALKYDIPVLLFKTMPYPAYGIDKYYIHTQKFLWEDVAEPPPKKFNMAAEHMRYERKELDKVMSGKPLYTTTVRKPLDHLKSVFNYFAMASKLGMPSNITDPAVEYIRNKDKYHFVGKRHGYHISNGISNMLGLADEDMYDDGKVEYFLHKIFEEFGLFMVTEYMAESFLLLRRKMCWEMTDVLYASINVRKYGGKKPIDDPELIQMHQQWNSVDYVIYNKANQTFWNMIQSLGSDFQEELALYREYNERIGDYCAPITSKLKRDPSQIFNLHRDVKPMRLDASRWGAAVDIDPVWCAATQIDIMPFYNILRVKQFPQICNYLDHDPTIRPHVFRLFEKTKKIKMVPDYCVENTADTMIPLEILATRYIYSPS